MRFFLPLLAIAAFVLTACDTFDKKAKVIMTVHSQGTDMDVPKTIFRKSINGQSMVFKLLPEFSQQNVSGIHPFPAEDGTFGVALKLDFKGTHALEIATRMGRGQILISMVNGTLVDYVQIDKPVTDGIYTIWRGLPQELITELEKKYPPIKSVASSSEFIDMSPSTKKEKKTAFENAKKAAKEKAEKEKAAKKHPRKDFDPELPGAGEAVPLGKLLKDQ